MCRTGLARVSAAALFFLLSTGSAEAASQLVRVPKDAKDLQAAINVVADGGVIEMAAGTYTTPPKGYEIANARKGFTVRAAAGASVVLNGGGTNLLLRFENGKRERGKLVVFERLIFRNGRSLTEGDSGGVTLSAAEARFVGCAFEDNQATGLTSGGGAVRILEGTEATFVDTAFRRNSSLNRGGAIEIVRSIVTLKGGELTDNRVNLPGHQSTSSGGGIYLLDSALTVDGVLFRGNQAGWVGGAIYAFGLWADPESTPRSLVQVSRSTFESNQALPDPGSPPPGQTTGGAIHVEDQSSLEIDSSVFTANMAEFGGAVDSYRAIVVVRGSWFQGNRAPLSGSVVGAGGAIFASSVDFADASTGLGAINRRPTRVTVSDSLLQGGGGSVANTGGCLLAAGDESRAYGLNGVPAAGTLEENRARVELRRTAFADCDVEPAAQGGGGSGGGMSVDLVSLLVEDSLVIDSDARGTNGSGGGMSIGRDSDASIVRTTFARNTAVRSGGALLLTGATVQIADSQFFSNEVSPGVSESISESRGAAIFSIPLMDPARPRNVGGLVSSSLFAANTGIPVFDNDPASGPINEMRYNNNQFYSTSFGDKVYLNNLADLNGASASALNSLVVDRGSRGSTDKSDGGNVRSTTIPKAGKVLAAPPFLAAGAPGSAGRSFLAYGWSGRSATLAGQSLSGKSGLLAVSAAGDFPLAVEGGTVSSARLAASACTSGPTLCLNGDRFVASVTWTDFQGNTGSGKAVSLTGDTGYFWFFNESNVELVVKVLDGRPLNGKFWVFYGALSSVEYTLTITDTATGTIRSYHNVSGRLASVGDTGAFPAGASAAAGSDEGLEAVPLPE